jgi:hypothetical protein
MSSPGEHNLAEQLLDEFAKAAGFASFFAPGSCLVKTWQLYEGGAELGPNGHPLFFSMVVQMTDGRCFYVAADKTYRLETVLKLVAIDEFWLEWTRRRSNASSTECPATNKQ